MLPFFPVSYRGAPETRGQDVGRKSCRKLTSIPCYTTVRVITDEGVHQKGHHIDSENGQEAGEENIGRNVKAVVSDG